MKTIRIGLAGLTALALVGATAGGAVAAGGKGTAAASITLLDVSLGDIQNLKILTQEGQGTMDPSRLGIDGPRAFGQITAVDASGIVNLVAPNPPLRSEAPGSAAAIAPQSISFPPDVLGGVTGTAGVALPIGAGLLAKGTLDPLNIDAVVDGAGARSGVGTEIPSLSILQGLISVNDVRLAGLSSNASATASVGDTGVVEVGSVKVLDLTALLGSLGIGLDDLGVGALTGLLDGLGLGGVDALGLTDLTGDDILDMATSTTAAWQQVKGVLDGLNVVASCSALASLVGPLDTVTGLLGTGGLLGGLGLPLDLSSVDTCSTIDAAKAGLIASLTSTVDGLTGTLDGLLAPVFSALEDAPLLEVSGIKLSALAHATDTLAGSKAETSAEFGTIKVGALPIDALDLGATVEEVTATVGKVQSVLGGVLGVLGPQFADIIDIGLLERSASTRTEGGYNVAQAGINALRVSINPPVDLSGALAPVMALPVGDLLGDMDLALPVLGSGLADNLLANAFGLTSLLTQPTTIVLGQMVAQSDFAADGAVPVPGVPAGDSGPVAPPVEGTLPHTGGEGTLYAGLAAIALLGAFGLTRTLRKAPVEG